MILEAMGFDEGEEGPAEVGFGARGKDEGDDQAVGGGPGLGEEAGEAGAKAGGIYDEVAGLPVVTKTAEDLIEIGVGNALPAIAGDDAVEGERRGGGGGGVDFNEGQGGEVVLNLRFLFNGGQGGEVAADLRRQRGRAEGGRLWRWGSGR